ncbi:MAG: TIGR02099 family protein, partial [Betaproteobacteria bacterium]|nr:TIGR02099 family protein [Betaproteobacteria bacterium]
QGRATASGYEFGVRNLALDSPRAAPMKATGLRVMWEPAEGARPQKGALDANLVELGPLVQLAEYLPLPADLRQVLAELAPQGNLLDAKLDWTGELPDNATFKVKMRFAGLGVKAWRSIPGFAGLSGSLEASEKKGMLYLAAHKSELDLPAIFPEPRIQLDSLNGEVAWELESGGAFAVRLPSLSFANPDLAGSAFGIYRWTGQGPGELDLSAQLSRADGRRTAKYLPLSSIVGPQTRRWVERAVVSGVVKEARLRIKGDLRDFPFTDPAKGQFQVAAKVAAGVLDYLEGWPQVSQIEADLLFERERMEVVGRSGAIFGARVGATRVSIPNLMANDPRLALAGSAEGPSADFLKFVQESGVRRMLSGATDGMSAQGRGRLRLRLDLPLGDQGTTRTSGEFQVTNNVLVVDPRVLPINAANGRIVFTEDSLNIAELRGTLFGGPVAISGGSKTGVPLAIVARGRGTVEGFSALFDHPWRKRLSGGAAYVATVSSVDGRIRTSFESTLEGVTSVLPEPLSKASGVALPLRVDILPGEGRERVVLALGAQTARIVAAEFLRVAAPGGALQTQRALAMINPGPGEMPRIPERRGLTVRGALPALDLDRWLPLLREGGVTDSTSGEGGASFDLKVGILDAVGRRTRNVTVKGVTEGDGWSASLDAAELAGDLLYRAEGGGRLVARFKHFSVPEVSPGAKEGEGVRDLPAVDLVAESFTHRGRRMGRVEIAARHEGRDWRIDKLLMVNPDSSLAGKGLWRTGLALRTSLADAAASRTALEFKLDVTDVGAFLARLGYPDHVKGGRGRLQGSVDWTGDPVTLDYATLGGRLDMQVDDGQFLEIEPGIGKLVSLMSLQMLPRRITMDFRDVFSKGFQFDRVTASLAIERGVMTTKDFRMRGPAAEVSMGGLVDLNLEAQNLQVRVIPRMDGVASTVVGLINPVAGVATMIAQKLLKDPLGQLAAFEYNITGTWTDPKVDKAVPAAGARSSEDRPHSMPSN